MDIKYTNIKNKLFEDAKRCVRLCMHQNCSKNAIKSHVLQKNGILNTIAENGHIMEFGIHPFDANLFKFKKVGLDNINNPFIFMGFCQEHDTSIFESIEKNQANYHEYKNQLLVNYRGLLNEKRKKEILIDWNNSRLLHDELKGQEDADKLKEEIQGYELANEDCKYLIDKMEEDLFLQKDTKNFIFHTKSISKIPICCSAVFTYETTDEINEMRENEPLTYIFLTIFPLETETLFIVGYSVDRQHKCQNYIDDMLSKTENELLELLSSILIGQIETWITSVSFYEENLKPIQNQLIDIINNVVLQRTNEREGLSINIFKKQ